MTDEKFVFTQDVRDKKITARSARNKRTHNGKGGAVRFPSDSLSRKELEAMNGKVEIYRLNDPMNWKEFKALPDDLKVCYITALRERYGVPDGKIAEMFGTSFKNFSHMVCKLGCSKKKKKGSKKYFDADAWFKWLNGISEPGAKEPAFECLPLHLDPLEDPVPNENVSEVSCCPVHENGTERIGGGTDMPEPHICEAKQTATPCNGNMLFECPANQALNMMQQVLGNALVHISITWDVIDEVKGEA